MRFGYGLLGALTVLGCSAPRADFEGPVATGAVTELTAAPPSAAIQDPTGVPPTSTLPTSSVAPLASVPSLAPPDGPIEKRFLPVDVKCEKDADCAVTKRGAHERLFCCDACDAVAGGKAWVARADLRCSAYDKEPNRHACPARDCAGPRGARCNHGACEAVY